MNLLEDVITYIRRIIKFPSSASISDSFLLDYINRFWINDVDPSMQLFDLKTNYRFLTSPGVDRYNMPLYDVQLSSGGFPNISFYPVYQGFLAPCYVNGIITQFYTQESIFKTSYPTYVNSNIIVGYGNGTDGPYSFSIPLISNVTPTVPTPPQSAILRGHVDLKGIIASGVNQDPPYGDVTGSSISTIPTTSVLSGVYFSTVSNTGENLIVADSGQFLSSDINKGLLMEPGKAPNGNQPLPDIGGTFYSSTINTIDYFTGTAPQVRFPQSIPDGAPIYALCNYYQLGIPRSVFFYNNTITIRPVPNTQYTVDLTAYLSPAAFLSTSDAVPFGYMSEYIARGAARKILSDTSDWEQFMQYEPLFLEQQQYVWKRSERQFTSTRTQTIYSSRGSMMKPWGVGNGLGLQ